MEVILKANVPNLGNMMDVVKVKNGYAMNYLIPNKLAIRATEEAKKKIAENREAMEALFNKELGKAKELAAKLAEVTVNFSRRVVEGDRLYGSVTAADIADELTKQGLKITRAQVALAEPLKQLGNYPVKVNVFGEVFAEVNVWVVKAD
ncbi:MULTISPECIES: 50S ribosomal protein L9 [Fibrobacter]|uniref:Large ribosomal subunit protein bL9 n=1 Tax=Fibrobacter intestinalis TaxID=28122 RepID=A0A1M6ZKF5_9BACT|nr:MULTISPECIES: 50S ribosomal protein L9 [Fibrobacter]MDD7299589.1 50S ribosomal protein L9 [Fibrobacter intestinalis]PBC67094.1 LSU ribosomal protein L9P [Fibrobacter sp. UWS1]PBC72874.1 LSU ribosomal protein L9P [Fibrobacter sp. NR9]SHL30952.1 LSU ribosomal protein L9P [Fibrobacter intestinalis]SJZ43985.1 large subunit ribosomal protein L9 [Fibrobacter intestinalis]